MASQNRKHIGTAAQMNAFANVASAPDNSVDIHADLIATGKMWWKPACSTFEGMGKMNSMPVELEPYLTRPDYAEKFEKFNELIKMEADNLKRRKKTCVFGSCPLAIFLPCWFFGIMAVHQKQLGKMVDRLEYHAKTVFADWKRQGIDIVFIPGKSGDGEGAGQMFDVPNTIRILYPRSAVNHNNSASNAHQSSVVNAHGQAPVVAVCPFGPTPVVVPMPVTH